MTGIEPQHEPLTARIDMLVRVQASEATFEEARRRAEANGMALSMPSKGHYQLRHASRHWIINLYPRRSGGNPRVYHDCHHRGPVLRLPRHWTLLDAVQAAIDAEMEGRR